MITLYWPDRLWTNGGKIARDFSGKITNWRTKPEGVYVDGEDFAGVVRWIADASPANDKEQLGAFTCAKLRAGRSIANVEFVTALGLDGDETGKSAREVHEMLNGYQHVVYTTHSSTPAAPRWRAILALSRRASGDEHRRYISIVHATMREAGVNLDRSAVDPCRLWYLPAYRMRQHFECYSADGAPFDVDRALTYADELEAEERATRAKGAPKKGNSHVAIPKAQTVAESRRAPLLMDRARAYVAKMPAAISGSEGHRATFMVARALVKDFELSDNDAAALLAEYNQRCQPPWSDSDLSRKLEQAKSAREAHPIADWGAR